MKAMETMAKSLKKQLKTITRVTFLWGGVFAVVSIAQPIAFAMVLLLFHWFSDVFTPLSMVCNGFHCFLNGFTVVFFDFQ